MPSVKYIKSAVFPKDFPVTKLKEVAFAGRSNAGKSSLINSLVDRKIANVSKTPGKTRLLSFFNFNDQYLLVDMPGYGFAARSRDEVDSWNEMIEGYLSHSEKLKAIVLVMDIRRDWAQEEKQMKEYAEHFGLSLILVLTKADKLGNSQILKRVQLIKEEALLKNIFVCSSLKKKGLDDLREHILKKIVYSKL
ncbi:MAG: YihA family ribosome biogenesis GTP-binding protein [Deltaproteobacteria bacterium]|jgi:GTP-binding protein|nr:YihA family ribosome biogenesis GTP-binding protein [Deltaproteobacteria bacterium]